MKASQKAAEDSANKKLILATARKLYYDRGMDDVSFDEIAGICAVTKSLIRYHFGSKAQLANVLFGTYSREQANVFFDKAFKLPGKYKHIDILSAYSIMCVRYYCQDPKALRFYTQLFSCSFTDISYGIEEFYRLINKDLYGDADKDVQHMYYIGAQYAARGLIYHFATGEIKCSEEEFNRYILFLDGGSFLSSEEWEATLKHAYEILDMISLRFLPEFVWE